MKKLIYPIILSFITFYMLFFYEPIVMYSGNINDFYFDLYTILPSLIIITLFLTIILSIIYYIINKICEKKNKKNVLNVIMLIHFAVFIVLYIHGNFLSVRLKMLDGAKIVWSDYIIDMVASGMIILIVTAFIILGVKAFNYTKTIKVTKYITLGIFGMLSVALISTLITTPKITEKKEFMPASTTRNYNTYSNDKNFIIFLADSVDSKVFDKVRKNSKYKDIFKDFTYFPDAMSGYSGSKNSLPQILTGMWDENEYYYDDYCKTAYAKSPFFKMLVNKKYDMNFYGGEFKMNQTELKKFSNFSYLGKNIDTIAFFKEEIKYTNFKYLPFFLKPFSNIESFKLTGKSISGIKDDYYDWLNKANYKYVTKNDTKKVDKNQFKFIHFEGAHVPYDMDGNLKTVKDGTYEQKIEATLKIYDAFLKKIKEDGVYDNSVILIMADHGASSLPDFWGRQNPMFLVKGIDEHHDFKVSDKAISYADLIDIYDDLLDGKKSDEIFDGLDNDRERRFLFYPDNYDKTIVEYKQKERAWDLDTLTKTGKVYKPYTGKAKKW